MATPIQLIIERIQHRAMGSGSVASAMLTGVFAGAMMVIMSVSYASLIFSGDLQPYLGAGIAIALTSVIIAAFMLAFYSSSAHMVPQIDDDTAPVFALFLAMLAASLPAGLNSAEFLTNLLIGIFIATALSGAVLGLLGLFRFGNLVQFLPYSVMGGYFAAVGWLLLIGALSMLTGIKLISPEDMLALFEPKTLWLWLPAVLFGLLLRSLSSKVSSGILLGGFVVIASSAFFLIQLALGNGPGELLQQGHLLGPFSEQKRALINPVLSLDWELFKGLAVLKNAGTLASICLISLLSIVLTVSSVSLTTRRDIDANRELKVLGLSNVVSGSVGGMLALPSMSISNLSYILHPKPNRLIALVAAVIGLLVFYFGMGLVAHTPKMVLGALLIFIGLGLVGDWLIDGLRKFGLFEYSVIPVILLVSIFAGFLQSIVAGIIAAILLFVIKYSRIKIIRYQASGANMRSNLTRDREQDAILRRYGDQIRLFALQGFLFFGTAGSLYREIINAVDDPANKNLRYLIVDFSQVIGADSSATLNFEKLAQRLAERKISLIATSLRESVLKILVRGGLDLANNAYLLQQQDLDQGLEFCENIILQEQGVSETKGSGLYEYVGRELSDPAQAQKLGDYLERMSIEAGEMLTRVDDHSDDVFFLESCTASAYIIDSRGQERRVSGSGRGSTYGEIGFFLGIPRTATVRADTDGEIYVLSRRALAEMEQEEPELAAVITRYLAKIVTERLVNTTQSLKSVL